MPLIRRDASLPFNTRALLPLLLLLALASVACGSVAEFATAPTDTGDAVETEAGAETDDGGAVQAFGAPETGLPQPTALPAADPASERPVLEVETGQAPATPSTTAAPAVVETSTTTTDPEPADPPPTQLPQPDTPAAATPTDPPATDPPPPAQTLADQTTTSTVPEPAPPPAGGPEPDCTVSCNIAMEGDSLTVGLGNRLCGAIGTGNCINSGIVGRRVDEMRVTAPGDVDNQLGGGNNDVVILWGGTNDLWQKFHSPDPATNAAAIYDQITAFIAERRAAGWDRVFVLTLPPMNPTYVVGTEPLNDLIRANGGGADGIIDVGADPRLADAFNPAMRAPDGIHFGDGGRAVVMEHILQALAALDGA